MAVCLEAVTANQRSGYSDISPVNLFEIGIDTTVGVPTIAAESQLTVNRKSIVLGIWPYGGSTTAGALCRLLTVETKLKRVSNTA